MFSPIFLPQKKGRRREKLRETVFRGAVRGDGGFPFFPKQGFAGGMPGIDGQGDRRRNRLEEVLGQTVR